MEKVTNVTILKAALYIQTKQCQHQVGAHC